MAHTPDVSDVIAELAHRGIHLPQGRVRLDEYGDSPELESELIELIKFGNKRGTAALIWSYEAEGLDLPQVGDIEIVLTIAGLPQLVTRVLSVKVFPFSEVPAEHAAAEGEGEGDGSLKYWQESHWEFFARECQRISRQPTPEMPIVCVQFELLEALP